MCVRQTEGGRERSGKEEEKIWEIWCFKRSSPPSTHPTCNSIGTLIRKYKTVMLSKIMILFLKYSYYFVIYMWKFWFWNHSVSLSLSAFFVFSFFEWGFCLHARTQMESFLYFCRITVCMYTSTALVTPLTNWGEVYYIRNYCTYLFLSRKPCHQGNVDLNICSAIT